MQVMMEWLADMGLDRKMLGLLQANAAAHQAYKVCVFLNFNITFNLKNHGVEHELVSSVAVEMSSRQHWHSRQSPWAAAVSCG